MTDTTCTTRLGWAVGDTIVGKLVDCDQPRGHLPPHSGAWKPTFGIYSIRLTWTDLDQRSFRGDWRPCVHRGCLLPSGHVGAHRP